MVVTGGWRVIGNNDGGALSEPCSLSGVSDATTGALEALAALFWHWDTVAGLCAPVLPQLLPTELAGACDWAAETNGDEEVGTVAPIDPADNVEEEHDEVDCDGGLPAPVARFAETTVEEAVDRGRPGPLVPVNVHGLVAGMTAVAVVEGAAADAPKVCPLVPSEGELVDGAVWWVPDWNNDDELEVAAVWNGDEV